MTFYIRMAGALVLFLALSLAAAWLYRAGGLHARTELAEYQAKAAQALADAQAQAREQERRHGQEMASIGERYEQDKRDTENAQERIVADLSAGAERLHDRWAGCVSEAGRTARELDEARRDREESAARAIAAARAADDQIRRLQDIIRADRAGQGD